MILVKLIITGSSGYLGSKVLNSLTSDLNKPILMDQKDSIRPINLNDKNSIRSVLNESNVEYQLIHLAGQLPGVVTSKSMLDNARNSIKNLLDIVNPKRILFISSTAVYPTEIESEYLKPAPWEIYGKTKLSIENYVVENSLNYTIFRCGTMYDKSRTGGIQKVLTRGLLGKQIFLPKYGHVFHPFIATSDVVNAIYKWIQEDNFLKNETVDLVCRNPITMHELISRKAIKPVRISNLPRIARKFGSDNIPFLGISKWHVNALFYNIHKFHNINGGVNLSYMANLLD